MTLSDLSRSTKVKSKKFHRYISECLYISYMAKNMIFEEYLGWPWDDLGRSTKVKSKKFHRYISECLYISYMAKNMIFEEYYGVTLRWPWKVNQGQVQNVSHIYHRMLIYQLYGQKHDFWWVLGCDLEMTLKGQPRSSQKSFTDISQNVYILLIWPKTWFLMSIRVWPWDDLERSTKVKSKMAHIYITECFYISYLAKIMIWGE